MSDVVAAVSFTDLCVGCELLGVMLNVADVCVGLMLPLCVLLS